MPRLPDIQEDFQRFVLSGDNAIESHVIGTSRVPVGTRLGIYGNGYRSRLVEALQASFPVMAAVLGETDFESLASQYISTHESPFFSVRYYGDALAEFLATDAQYSTAPVLAELARWEWAMAAVFDAADAEPIDVSAFAHLAPEDWDGLCFEWSPAVQVLELQWNVPDLWKAVTQETAQPDPALYPQPTSWLVWRQDLQIYFRPLAAEEAGASAAARAGRSFAELCLLLCEHLDEQEAAGHAAAFLRGWVQSGLIVGLKTGRP
jgi:hypothetical protein